MDLNIMMREQAKAGLQRELNDAVTNGDTEAAAKVTEKIAALAVAAAPKAPPFTGDDVKAELDKLPWFGVDPVKSQRALELGKHMDLRKFSTAAAFAEAVVKAVEAKPAGEEPGGEGDGDGEGEGTAAPGKDAPKPKKTDSPGEGDNLNARPRKSSGGPWEKMADAPSDVQKEIRRQAGVLLSSKATKEQREAFEARALESHYNISQQKKGK